ncbi:APC family permease [Amycolatopsis saalfeldensis]|uniref:Permease, urea carboxylase system n=1 Tax=Amycolatopsis saalfeldensis TaxID=394193 RepID=A0A1H8YRA8_9PSEU|nr:APC family permease [Amycolatopsis saalfeldensis]SEP54541.1 permease, urea carboxylase system [Amycolatopsis saalfeldensis]
MASSELSHTDEDQAHLESLGYKQRLRRTLGTFDSFAFAFSYFSEISNLAIVLGLGLALGGPAFIWSWPMVVGGMLLVTFLFCELAAHYPVAGSVYNWSKALARSKIAPWLTGWLVVIAVIVAFASMAPAFGLIMPQLWQGFQLVGDGKGQYDFAANTVILGAVFIGISCLFNCVGTRTVSRINKIGIRIEIIASIVFVIAFLFKAKRSPAVLFETADTGTSHHWGYAGAFLAAAIASAYSLTGMDAASDMAEETVNPRKAAPRSMLYAVGAAAVTFFVLTTVALMAVPNPASSRYASGGLPAMIIDVFGETWGKIALIVILMALISAALAVQSFAIRVTFGMARDNNLPFGARLSRVSEKTGTPITLTILIGVIAIAILVLNVRQPQIAGVIGSMTVALMYLAYLGVVGPMLFARLRGRWPAPEHAKSGYFHLGRWGTPITIASFVYLIAGFINLIWPRQEIFNPAPPYHWYLQWSGFLFSSLVVAAGLALYYFYQRHRTGVVAEHVADRSKPLAGALGTPDSVPPSATPGKE